MKLFTQIDCRLTKTAEVGIKAVGVGNTGLAEEMEKEGKSKEEIWKDTGWYRGDDNKWRFEIDDSKSKLRLRSFSKRKMTTSPNTYYSFEGRLEDVFSHPHVFVAYPELRNWEVKISFDVGPDTSGHTEFDTGLVGRAGGWIDPVGGRISVAGGLGVAPTVSALIHEIQHAIQEIEDFSKGGSPSDFRYDKNVELSDQTKETIRDIDAQIAALKKEDEELSEYFRALPDSEKGAGKNKEQEYRKNTIMYRMRELKDKRQEAQRADKKKDSKNKYMALPGEIESRLVQRRLDMPSKQRKSEPPWVTREKMLQDEKDGTPRHLSS